MTREKRAGKGRGYRYRYRYRTYFSFFFLAIAKSARFLFLKELLLLLLRRESASNFGNRSWGEKSIVMIESSLLHSRDSIVPWRGFIIAVITVLAIVSAIVPLLLLLHRGQSCAVPASPTAYVPNSHRNPARPAIIPLLYFLHAIEFFFRRSIRHFAILRIRAPSLTPSRSNFLPSILFHRVSENFHVSPLIPLQ